MRAFSHYGELAGNRAVDAQDADPTQELTEDRFMVRWLAAIVNAFVDFSKRDNADGKTTEKEAGKEFDRFGRP